MAEIRVCRMYKLEQKSRSDWHSGTGDNRMIAQAVCPKIHTLSNFELNLRIKDPCVALTTWSRVR